MANNFNDIKRVLEEKHYSVVGNSSGFKYAIGPKTLCVERVFVGKRSFMASNLIDVANFLHL